MKPGKVRSIAICVFYHHGRILVAEGYDHVKRQTFYRPLGGTIEFGETGAKTVARELKEELDILTSNVRYLGTLENIFVYDGQPGHEIVLVYDGKLVDQSLYDRQVFNGQENNHSPIKALWKDLSDFSAEIHDPSELASSPLYPTGLLELLREKI